MTFSLMSYTMTLSLINNSQQLITLQDDSWYAILFDGLKQEPCFSPYNRGS
jgi:hypothetical protein